MPLHVSALRGTVDAVILTIRKDEDQAVANLLGALEPTTGGRSYRIAKLRDEAGQLTVALLRLAEPGNGPAQDAAHDAIVELAPRILVLVGIAGAVPAPEFTLGDVMIATRISDMRVQALVADSLPQLEVRGERVHKKLADRLNNLIELSGWADKITQPRPPTPLNQDLFKGSEKWNKKIVRSLTASFHTAGHRESPLYFTGTIGASDFLVKDDAALDHWLHSARKIETVEMEAAGVMEAAARLDATYPVMVVRGISDIVGYERDPTWTTYACQSAAAFAIAILRSGQLADIHPLVARPSIDAARPDRATTPPRAHSAQLAATDHRDERSSARDVGADVGDSGTRSNSSTALSILIVFANPRGTSPLRLSTEDRAITEAIRRSKNRSHLRITTCHAATVHDVSRALLDADFDIVQISGHGTRSGLVLELDDGSRHVVPQTALADLLQAYAPPRGRLQCAILNACYSLSTGTLTSMGVPCTIAMEGPISDDAAIEFSRGFYDAIGAGKSISFAYEEGRRRVNLASPGSQFVAAILAPGESREGQMAARPAEPQEPDGPLSRAESSSAAPRPVLVGCLIDVSASMNTSLRNNSGGAMTRLEGFRRALDRIASDTKRSLREQTIRSDGAFDIFAYGFGLRVRHVEHADLFSLLQVARDLISKDELQRLKDHHAEQVKREYDSSAERYSQAGDLASRWGLEDLVRAVTSRIRAQAEDQVRQRVLKDVGDRIAARLRDIGDTTLSLDEFSQRWEESGDSFKSAEELLFGNTPMCSALVRVRSRLEHELKARAPDTAATLFVLSDGEPTDGSPGASFDAIKGSGVTVISCFVTDKDIADPRTLYGAPLAGWPLGAALMFEAASRIDDDSDVARFLLQKGWTLRPNARLFVQLNHSAVLDEFVDTLLVPLRQRDSDWQLPVGDATPRPL